MYVCVYARLGVFTFLDLNGKPVTGSTLLGSNTPASSRATPRVLGNGDEVGGDRVSDSESEQLSIKHSGFAHAHEIMCKFGTLLSKICVLFRVL
jgi:hypothetical protein